MTTYKSYREAQRAEKEKADKKKTGGHPSSGVTPGGDPRKGEGGHHRQA